MTLPSKSGADPSLSPTPAKLHPEITLPENTARDRPAPHSPPPGARGPQSRLSMAALPVSRAAHATKGGCGWRGGGGA